MTAMRALWLVSASASLGAPLTLTRGAFFSSQAASRSHRSAPIRQRRVQGFISEFSRTRHRDRDDLPSLRATCTPLFDFTLADPVAKRKSAASFERIDDAIMGGISLSALRDVPDRPYASWAGVCRTDGGGFCGLRTRPLSAPLDAAGQAGAFVDCRLASDADAGRRVWKMSVRTDTSRGEVVYQAEFDLRGAMDEAKPKAKGKDVGDEGWARVMLPFDDFQLVRGPRLVPDGPKLNATGGIFQIGMTMSKFRMARNTTEIENFRAGPFEMHIQRMGFYSNDGIVPVERMVARVPDTLSEEEAAKKRPLVLKILLPVAKLFFSEKAQRRKSAMRILRERRALSRGQAILFGIRSRSHMGRVRSIMKTLGILSVDVLRAMAFFGLKITLVYPLRAVSAIVRGAKRRLGMKVKPSLRE